MTKKEAIEEMKKGKKITHRWFSPNEWMTIEFGKLTTEDGYSHDWDEFWKYRNDESWQDGYSIFEN